MVYAFSLPTTSPLSFKSFVSSSTHPSLPQSASTTRHALRLALKAHKRLPRGPRQDAHLHTVLSALNEYLPYLFATSHGLSGRPVRNDSGTAADGAAHTTTAVEKGPGEEIEITLRAEIETVWQPTLSAGSTFKLKTSGSSTGTGKGIRSRSGRVQGRGIDFEIAFTLTTLGYVLSRLARRGVVDALYATTTPTPEQRTAAVQTATRHLLQASAVHELLSSSPAFTAAAGPAVPDLDSATQSALSSLALAEATLLAVLKDDAYIAACIQSRNPNDREWMVRSPEIPKVRALLFARLCVRAAEYAEQAAAGLGAVGSSSGRAGRVDDELTRYAGVLGRVSRARACRFFGIDAELAGKVGEGIAWLRAARTALGLRGGSGASAPETNDAASGKGGLSRLKDKWAERREERRIGKDAGGGRERNDKGGGTLDPGDDAGRDEEGQVIEMLQTKWVRMNDTINTQLIPPSAPLLSNLPSGRDIHSPPVPYKPPCLDDHHLVRMRAPPDENEDPHFHSDDSDEESPVRADGRGLPGGFPDRSQTATSTYY